MDTKAGQNDSEEEKNPSPTQISVIVSHKSKLRALTKRWGNSGCWQLNMHNSTHPDKNLGGPKADQASSTLWRPVRSWHEPWCSYIACTEARVRLAAPTGSSSVPHRPHFPRSHHQVSLPSRLSAENTCQRTAEASVAPSSKMWRTS